MSRRSGARRALASVRICRPVSIAWCNYSLVFVLEAVLAESRADLDAGRFVKETVAQHIRRINKLNTALAA